MTETYKTITTGLVAEITGGTLTGNPDLPVLELVTDSRYQGVSAGQLFIAIRGINHDGHDFVEQLYQRGIRSFMVERDLAVAKGKSDAAFIKVSSSVGALQAVAAYRRKQFGGRVIAITGSAGKTIVKEWLADLIGLTGKVTRSPKSYNSQIGVPLSVWRLDANSATGIFEAGISQPGEMEHLQKVIMPEIGVFTNIGEAHSKNFSDIVSKAAEKLLLFRECRSIIYCSDHRIIHDLILNDPVLNKKEITDWSFENSNARVFVTIDSNTLKKSDLTLTYSGKRLKVTIPFGDRASIENAITVAVVCLSVSMDTVLIARALASLESVAMRMEIRNGINGCMVVEDYYNSDPGSLKMAIDYIRSQNSRPPVLILSDFVQSGRKDEELYGEVAQLIRRKDIKGFTGIGEAIYGQKELFPADCRFYRSVDEFIKDFHPSQFSNEIILLKGARIFEFERISRLLEQQVHQTVLEINLDAISHNLNEYRRIIKPGTRIMVMVKAFAYGAGPAEIAALMEYHRVDYLAVAYADEGVELREAGVLLPIMVMNPESSAFEMMIRHNLEPEIYSINLLRSFIALTSKHGLIHYPVHIKIDSGMHRLGFLPGETESIVKELISADSVLVKSVFTHLAASEDPSLDGFTHGQMEKYMASVTELRKATGYDFLRHALNSAGIVRFPEYQLDMVRPGIGIYGGQVAGLDLRQTGRFRTRISQVKRVPAGEPVGYGCRDISDRLREIAVLPVGYADGMNRRLGNGNGRLFIKGKFVTVTGNICMDMCMVDVTGIGAEEGDEAEVFGDNIPVAEVAEKCETIPYEILTSIPARVKRVFYRE